jgi:hypothetical protein
MVGGSSQDRTGVVEMTTDRENFHMTDAWGLTEWWEVHLMIGVVEMSTGERENFHMIDA